MRALTLAAGAVALVMLAGCDAGSTLDPPVDSGGADEEPSADASASAAPPAPEVGTCRVLTAEDVAQPDNATEPVDCREQHTAETFHVGELPADADYDDPGLADRVYPTCQKRWVKFTGADESLALRTVLSWAWFRPSEAEWDQGARWYRCDLVGGLDRPAGLVELPRSGEGVLLGRPGDRWLACVNAETVQDAPFLPCNEEHSWRAVSTIVVSEKKKYPGGRLVEVLSRDYCSDSVLAWLDYPPQFDFGYSYFGEAEWEAGNNRAICWARTSE